MDLFPCFQIGFTSTYLANACSEIILSSVARVMLCLLTAWPTSLSPTINRTRMYYKKDIWNSDGQHLENMLLRKVDIDGVEHIKCNQRKFPVQLLRLALFTLGKCSQRNYPLRKFDQLLHINVEGTIFALSHNHKQ